jgi:hypothetical protein
MSTELPAESLFEDSPTDAHRAMLALLHDVVVEAGSWRPGIIRCAACQEPFAESL